MKSGQKLNEILLSQRDIIKIGLGYKSRYSSNSTDGEKSKSDPKQPLKDGKEKPNMNTNQPRNKHKIDSDIFIKFE